MYDREGGCQAKANPPAVARRIRRPSYREAAGLLRRHGFLFVRKYA